MDVDNNKNDFKGRFCINMYVLLIAPIVLNTHTLYVVHTMSREVGIKKKGG